MKAGNKKPTAEKIPAKKMLKKVKKSAGKKGKKDFRTEFLAHLSARKTELEEAVNFLTRNQKEYEGAAGAGDFNDEIDDAQREISAQNHYLLIERKKFELRKISLLMDRVSKNEEFGLCEECGKPIPKERLMVIPEAALCVPCQREMEEMDSKTR